ncbi:hypothetical protein F2Q70_00042654 [Brassica cretica]|uniref:RING-type E3 ubiquitin transferase n=1 Tax=Brassica cretica TaxID=69181 RepID=A0A8S9KEY6_BRACR|nr:hypothetical protein F2Q70_00042654 [Brassica cretica]
MSSAGNSTESSVAAAETDKMFFCHQCNQTITITISSAADPFCPLCNLGFLEEYTDPIPNLIFPISDPPPSSRLPFIPVMDFTNLDHDPDAFDPVSFIHSHLQQLQSSGINVQMLFENHHHHHGDYFFGRGLEDLIQQLGEDDPNRYGPPPASKSAVEALPTVKLTEEMLRSDMKQCAVCMEEFEDGVGVKEMPCRHVYHHDCLLPWLRLHNTCPVCRHELPTDDVDYENRRRGGGQTSGGGEGERRFSVSFPWSFRRQDAGSDSGSGSDMDTRQDELD